MADKNLTIFQKLTKMIGRNPEPQQQETPQQQSQVFNINRQELLRTQDRAEYEQKRLELQQSKYLMDKWMVIEKDLSNKLSFYETTRLAAYFDYESMEYCLHGGTKIATPQGFITIKELAEKGRNYEFIVYAYDHSQGKIIPTKAHNAHYTRDEMTYKVIFDDGSFIIGTKEHRLMKRDGSYSQIDELKPGDSMMPFYRKSFYNNQNYNWVYTCNKNEGHHGWVAEHNLIAEWYYNQKINKKTEEVHHLDFNGKNNLPENLAIMDKSEHRSYHCKLNNEKLWSNPEFRKKMSSVAKRKGKFFWNGKRAGSNNPTYFEVPISHIIESAIKHKTLKSVCIDLNISFPKILREIRKEGYKDWADFLKKNNIHYKQDTSGQKNPRYINLPFSTIIESAKLNCSMSKTAIALNVSVVKLRRELALAGYRDWVDFCEKNEISKSKHHHIRVKGNQYYLNHKVADVIPYGVVPVYDMTVPGFENFATDTIFSHNCPEIATSMDIISEEATQSSEKGYVLSIFSESKRVKNELTNLFNNILDVNTNLQMWTRNTVKYGDNFVYLKVDPDKGIVGCYQLPNIEIERLEGEQYKQGANSPSYEITSKEDLQPKQVKFRWKNKNMEFQSWEIAHFRLLGDDRMLPYGTSILNKARRVYKQLLLAEDAMLTYRISRAAERRVFKIFVGNMDDNDVEAYVQRVANKFKRDYVADPQTGQVDARFNSLSSDMDFFIPVRDPSASSPIETLPGACIALDTKIPLLDGRTLSLQEIINEWDDGNRNLWVYSCDPKTGAFQPLPITWAGVTRKDAQVMKITLDNGETITTTPDHKFVHRTNGFVEAQNLKVGDSLMPFYRQEDYIKYGKNKTKNTYEQIWDNQKQQWIFTHRAVAKFLKPYDLITESYFSNKYKDAPKVVIHHKDFNRYNNSPSNLTYMDKVDHILLHSSHVHLASEAYSEKYKNNETFRNEVNARLRKGTETFHSKRKSDPEYDAEISKKQSLGLTNYINSLSETELNERHERLQKYATVENIQTMLEWRKDPENNKLIGEKISKAYTKERKTKQAKTASELWKDANFRKTVISKQILNFTDELYNIFVETFATCGRADLTLEKLNGDTTFLAQFAAANSHLTHNLINLSVFTHNHVDKMMKGRGYRNYRDWAKQEAQKRGYKSPHQWRYYIDKENDTPRKKYTDYLYNHKIVSIEWLEERQDTGTITVDGNELYSNAHTFGIQAGIYIKNSNLGEIQDIEYILKKLVIALRVPKAFLGFEEVVGEGKGLSLLDIRFARMINRVQKSMIQELNKIAIIHLFLLGLEDELENFTLGLTNPSTQADLLKIEAWKEKILLYKDATMGADQDGIAPTSHTFAKKYFLGMTDTEVILDLQQQKMERGIKEELMNSKDIKTGIFNKINDLYSTGEAPAGEGEETSGGGGGGQTFSTPGGETGTPETGEAGGGETGGGEGGETAPETAETGGGEEEQQPETAGTAPTLSESLELIIKKKDEKNGFIFDRGKQQIDEINRKLNNLLND